MLHLVGELTSCLSRDVQVVTGDQARISVGPPDTEPEQLPRVWINPNVQVQAETLPFVVLINTKEVIDPSGPGAFTSQTLSFPFFYQLFLIYCKIGEYNTSASGINGRNSADDVVIMRMD